MSKLEERHLMRIVEAPPPSEEQGYELVYSNTSEYRGSDINRKVEGEKMSFWEFITSPGMNIIMVSLISGLALLGYVLYMYFQ